MGFWAEIDEVASSSSEAHQGGLARLVLQDPSIDTFHVYLRINYRYDSYACSYAALPPKKELIRRRSLEK